MTEQQTATEATVAVLRRAGDSVLYHLEATVREGHIIQNPAYYEMLAQRLRDAGFVAAKEAPK